MEAEPAVGMGSDSHPESVNKATLRINTSVLDFMSRL